MQLSVVQWQHAREGDVTNGQGIFHRERPIRCKRWLRIRGMHEQSMLSVNQGYNLCRDDTDPCGFAEKCQKICGSGTETSLPIPTSPHTPSPPVPVPAPTPPPSNVIGEGDPHVSSLTDDHRPDGDAPYENGPETGRDPGVIRWRTRPFNKVERLRQAAQKWQPDFDKYVGGIMDSRTREEFDAFIPTEEALRCFTHWATYQWLQRATRLRFLLPDCRG